MSVSFSPFPCLRKELRAHSSVCLKSYCGNSWTSVRFGLTGKSMDSGKTHSVLPIKGEETHCSSSLLSPQPVRTLTLSFEGSGLFFVFQQKKMALSQKSCTLLFAVVAAVCIQLFQGELKYLIIVYTVIVGLHVWHMFDTSLTASWKLFAAAHDVPARCSCPSTIKFIRGNISDFQVLEKRSGCDRKELM